MQIYKKHRELVKKGGENFRILTSSENKKFYIFFEILLDFIHITTHFLIYHRVLEQEGGLTNYTKRSDTVRVAGATPLTTPHVRTNHRILVF